MNAGTDSMIARSGKYTGYGLEKIIKKFKFRIKRLRTTFQQMALPVFRKDKVNNHPCTLVYSCTL